MSAPLHAAAKQMLLADLRAKVRHIETTTRMERLHGQWRADGTILPGASDPWHHADGSVRLRLSPAHLAAFSGSD